MSEREVVREIADDPTQYPGDIAGPGGPNEVDGVVIDATNAVLMDEVDVCLMLPEREGKRGETAMALLLGGRVNKRQETARVLFMFGPEAAATLVSEIAACVARGEMVPGFQARFSKALEEYIPPGIEEEE